MHASLLTHNTTYCKTNMLANYATENKEYISSYGGELSTTSESLQGPSHFEEQLQKHWILAYDPVLLT